MPDLVTHHLFGKDAYELMNEQNKKIINSHQMAYSLGCNGPDYFFYYHVVPIKSQKNVEHFHQMGNEMHNLHIDLLFTTMFSYLKEHYDETLHSYILGFIMHYYADRNCHPYIYYFTGLSEVNKIYGYYHKLIEVQIDQMLLDIFKGEKIGKYKPAHILKHNDQVLQKIYPMVEYVLENVYQKSITYEEFKESWDDFEFVEKICISNKMFKKKLVENFEKIIHAGPFFSTAVYAPDFKEYDVLNLKKNVWYDPCDHSEHNETFIDCYLKGVNEVGQMINALDVYLSNGSDDYLKLTNGCTFDTNQPEDVKQKYYKCMYEGDTR